MTIMSTLTSAIVALGIAATTVQAHAETEFSTLAGIEAEPMNAAEMEAVQGKARLDYGWFSVDNDTYPGWLHFDVYATGSHYAVDPTTGASYLSIGNQWFPAMLFGGATVTVGPSAFGDLEPIIQTLNGR